MSALIRMQDKTVAILIRDSLARRKTEKAVQKNGLVFGSIENFRITGAAGTYNGIIFNGLFHTDIAIDVPGE